MFAFKKMAENKINQKVTQLNQDKDISLLPEKFSNQIFHSSFESSLDSPLFYKSNFSIKYVLKGKEIYHFDEKKHQVAQGQYLIINDAQEIETSFLSRSEGISIFFEKVLVEEVYQALTHPEHQLMETAIQSLKLPGIEFFENTYFLNNPLGQHLELLSAFIIQSAESKTILPLEFYYGIVEQLILSQKQVRLEIGMIERHKKSTREELYRRALIARHWIEEASLENFNLDALSKQAGLSKYHLIRVFKNAFQTTPYHYYLTCKVERAKTVLLSQPYNLGQIALQCGFNDEFAFSKTFKKFVGLSPSEYRLRCK